MNLINHFEINFIKKAFLKYFLRSI